MPLVSVLLPGQQGYLEWKVVIHGKEIPYGLFLGEVVNFLIVAVSASPFLASQPQTVTVRKRIAPPPAAAKTAHDRFRSCSFST